MKLITSQDRYNFVIVSLCKKDATISTVGQYLRRFGVIHGYDTAYRIIMKLKKDGLTTNTENIYSPTITDREYVKRLFENGYIDPEDIEKEENPD